MRLAIHDDDPWKLAGALTDRRLFCVRLGIGSVWLWPATEYLPTGNRNLVIAILLPPAGYNVDKMIQMGENIERRLTPYWADEPKPGVPRIRDFFFVARGRMLFLGAKAVDDLRGRIDSDPV